MKKKFLFFAFTFLCLTSPLHAQNHVQNLNETLLHVYETNPTLEAARMELQATLELYPQALAGWRPTISAETGIFSTEIENSNFSGASGTTTKNMSINLDQPLYRGGSTMAQTAKAKNLIKAGHARLLQNYESIFLRTVTSYMNIIRDRQLLKLSQDNKKLLQEEFSATEERYNGGELTRTDIDQAEARLARAEADTLIAWNNLETSNTEYEQITALHADQELKYPEISFIFPQSIDELMLIAEENNPTLLQILNQHEAAQNDIDSIEGELWPQISAYASILKEYDPQPGVIDDSQTGTIGIRARLSLYQAGLTQSRIRQAKSTAAQREDQIEESRRAVRQDIVSQLNRLKFLSMEIKTRFIEIKAKETARNGVREEERMGERTVLDILDAEQELLDAQSSLIKARRNEIVAAYELASTLGYLFPEKLGFVETPYDLAQEYKSAGNKIFSLEPE